MLSFEIWMMKVFDLMCDAVIEIENIIYGNKVTLERPWIKAFDIKFR